MSIAAFLLLGLVFALVLFDAITQFRKNRRGLAVEIFVFLGGAFFIAFPSAQPTWRTSSVSAGVSISNRCTLS